MTTALSQIILDVVDLERSLGFYSGLLHLTVAECNRVDGCRMATLQTGGTKIVLVQQPHDEMAYDRMGGVVLNFWVNALKAMPSRLAHLGCTVLRGLECDLSGNCSILVADPDGYAVLLSEKSPKLN